MPMTESQGERSRKALRDALELDEVKTQQRLAGIIGKSQAHVSLVLAGRAEIDAVDCVKLEKATGIPRHRFRPDCFDRPRKPTKRTLGANA